MDKRKTNVAGGTDRELTPGECQIAAGQILDRLTRYFSAGREIFAAEKVHCADCANNEKWRAACDLATAYAEKARPAILEKYRIPAGVSFEVNSFEEIISPLAYYVGKFRKYILPFVSGTMTGIELADLVFRGEETVECDYHWIFLDRPSFYYMTAPPGWVKPHVEDFRKIGWRNMKGKPDRIIHATVG